MSDLIPAPAESARSIATKALLECALLHIDNARSTSDPDDICHAAIWIRFAIQALGGVQALHADGTADQDVTDVIDMVNGPLAMVYDMGFNQHMWINMNHDIRNSFWTIFENTVPGCRKALATLFAKYSN